MKKYVEEQIHEFAENMYSIGYNEGVKDGQGNKTSDTYTKGLNDAWECARKIMQLPNDTQELFYLSAKEAITKIKEYEEAEAETKEQVNQWDEIYYNSNPRHKAVIINISKENEWNCLDKDNEMVSIDTENQKYWHKTGKNYSKCMNILEQLQGE